MRDNFNISALSNNMFNNLNSLIPLPNSPVVTMTNISTNVYYGYQSLPAKNDHRDLTVDENTAMEIQRNYLPENLSYNPEILGVLSRKRRCSDSEQKLEFKKRRLTDNRLTDLKGNYVEYHDLKLEEELLKQTHGFCSYHWRMETDL